VESISCGEGRSLDVDRRAQVAHQEERDDYSRDEHDDYDIEDSYAGPRL
jgi:hypothetical protein